MRYEGTLNTRNAEMDPLAKRAFGIWLAQVRRCSNANCKTFKTYGANGIRVEYGNRDFIGWWINEFKGRRWTRPSVGRIDHSRNYSFDNIEMVEHSENAREMYQRTGGNKEVEMRPVVLIDDERTHIFSSTKAAAKFAGVTASMVCLRKRVKADPKKKTKFPYEVYDFEAFMKLGGAA